MATPERASGPGRHAPALLLRTVSAEGLVDLRHPTPDLQTMHGAYVKNIEKLEQSAEELSQGGSDIGEEIRKMKQEQDRASRRSSLASLAREASREGRQTTTTTTTSNSAVLSGRSRNASTSSYANSIVDVNTAARWGGYSPGGYITSPSVSRVSSFHRPSGLPEPVQEGRPLDSPLASPSSYFPPTRRPSQQSMSRANEDMAEPLERHDETREEHDEDWELMKQQHAEDKIREEQTEEALRRQRSHEDQHERPEHAEDDEDPHGYHSPEDDQHHNEYRHNDEVDDHQLARQQGEQDDRQPIYYYPPNQVHQAPHHHPELDHRSSTPDTYRQARTLFHDFDGVHFSPTTEEFVELDEAGKEVKRVSSLQFQEQVDQQQGTRRRISQQGRPTSQMPRPISYAQPPPGENMVYYPAPVPRMLNLPKRLSQLPAANVQAQRRSQMMMMPAPPEPEPAEVRKSWLPVMDFEEEHEGDRDAPEEPISPPLRPQPVKQRQSMMNPRLSRMSMAGLPPQLRASVYFDQPSVYPQDVQVKSESAVATLDSILAASVNAPVSVFTDHPYAGHIGSEVYKSSNPNRKSTATLINYAKSAHPEASEPAAERGHRHNRTASSGTFARPVPVMQKRNSIVSMLTDLGNPGGNKLKKRNSKMSLATDLGLSKGEDGDAERMDRRTVSGETEEQAAERETETGVLRSSFDGELRNSFDEGQLPAEEDEEDYEQNQFDEKYPFYAQPTTLLAELQLRKAQQKTRNRTAVTAFPNGMHSTLLELDAVAQVEKSKRKQGRTRLAWEDPTLTEQDQNAADEDEDVPLGMLFPEQKHAATRAGRAAVADWDKPLGLLERRELEDNEPLSRRRNRLRGISPDHHLRVRAQQAALLRQQEAAAAAAAIPLPADSDDEEYADETLAQRLQRLKRKEALNSALGDLAGEDASKEMSTFTDDILNQFGGTEPKAADKQESAEMKPTEALSLAPSALEAAEHEGETLGQRRARLQREKLALQDGQRNVSDPVSTGASTARPPLHTSVSLANLLAIHPVSATSTSRVKTGAAAGTLLGDNAKAEADAKKKLLDQNARATSNNVPRPGMTTSKSATSFALPQQYYPQQRQTQYPMQMQYPQQQQMYPQMNTGMGMMGYNQQQMYPQFAQPTVYPMQNQMGTFNANMYAQMPAMQQYNTTMNPGMVAGPGQPGSYAALGYDEMSLSQGQRDLIDRWRLSVAQ